jgi:hypothetical protein
MKNKFIKSTLALSAFLLMFSCSEDDATGKSTQTPTAPSLTVGIDFNENQSLVETDRTYDFTVNLSEAQIVDVLVNVAQTSGTATNGEDFSIPSTILIPAGATSAAGTIELFEDDLAEETETAQISLSLGNEANLSSVSGQVINFEILNVEEDDLIIDLSWTNKTTITDNLGNAIDGEDLADLALLVTAPVIPFDNSDVFEEIDLEYGFEQWIFSASTYPDATIHLAARFFDVADYGDAYTDLDLTLTFNQKGVVNSETITIPSALNTAYAYCQEAILASVTKAGTDFTYTAAGVNNLTPIADGTYVGSYTVSTTVAGNFGAQFDQVVELIDLGGGVRGFTADWNGFGSDADYTIQFDPNCGRSTFTDSGNDTGLACPGDPNIIMGPSTNGSTTNPTDDTTLVVTYTENVLVGCGVAPAEATITFVKN